MPIKWLIGWLLVLYNPLTPFFQYAQAKTMRGIQIRDHQKYLGRLGQSNLLHILENKGFSICEKIKHQCPTHTIRVQIQKNGKIVIRQSGDHRSFQIPTRYTDPQTRARTIATFVSLFVAMKRTQTFTPTFQPPPDNQIKKKKNKPPQQKKAHLPKSKKRTIIPKRSVPKRPMPKAFLTKKSILHAKQTPSSIKRKKSVIKRQILPKKVAQQPKQRAIVPKNRTNISKRRTLPKKVAFALKKKIKKPLKNNPLWFQLGLGGLAGVQASPGIPVGGLFFFGGGLGRLALNLSLNVQPIPMLESGATALLSRIDLLGAFVPYRQAFGLSIEFGGSLEIISLSLENQKTLQLRWGLQTGLKLSWNISPSWQLFVRPAFLFFPQSYQLNLRGKPILALSTWRGEISLGVQWNL